MRHIRCALLFLPCMLLGCAHPIVIIPDEIGDVGYWWGPNGYPGRAAAEGHNPVIGE